MKPVIYRIVQKDKPDMFYIGSTVNFSRRKSHHKKNVNNKKGKLYWTKLYTYIRTNGNWDNFEIHVIEDYDYKTYGEGLTALKQREQYYIDLFKPTLNAIKACITNKYNDI
jgi:group I intron endonuclease